MMLLRNDEAIKKAEGLASAHGIKAAAFKVDGRTTYYGSRCSRGRMKRTNKDVFR